MSSSSSVIYGISFDVEDTLITTKGISADQHYQQAFDEFPKKHLLHQPTWMMNNDLTRRTKLFNEAWIRASVERNAARKIHSDSCPYSDDDVQKCKTSNFAEEQYQVEQVDEFYFLVVTFFFEFDDSSIPVVREFVQFLVHDYWVSERAYSLPLRNLEKLIEIKEKYPAIPLCIVSNTDHRVIKAVRLFPIYREIFGVENGMIVTASNVDWIFDEALQTRVPGVKPYPTGILTCMKKSGFAEGESKNMKKKWLHVGDSKEEDGGAASNAGTMFLHCDASIGVDFGKVLEMLESS